MTVSVGQRLGTYDLVKPLAHGGMAEVFLGRSAAPGYRPHVAVKVLSARRATERDSRAMFEDEARLVGLLDHPNIARVLEVAVEAGVHYLAMEYIHGADLRELVLAASRHDVAVPYEIALSIVTSAAAGLDHAHRRCDPQGKPLHLVHRDVSLSNIMVSHDGAVKVVDFGIARSTISTVHTMPGVVRGKASYMSPEQCKGDAVDHRSDVFALGVVLYELTTGARCFHGKTDFERMLAVVRGEYLAPRELVADYPPELEAVIRTALAADPAARYGSCAQLIEALEHVMAARGWIGGPLAIGKLMQQLFGTVAEPWADEDTSMDLADVIEGPPTEQHAEISTEVPAVAEPCPTAKLTGARRLARGTLSDMFDPKHWQADADDAVTRGRRPIRRPMPAHRAV